MSGYSRNAVYNYVSNAITAANSSVYCTSRFVPKPSSFPACYIHEIGRSRPIQHTQLDFEDVQWESDFEIQVISNQKGTAASDAYEIMDIAKSAMNALFYREFSETAIDGTETFTIVARFRRKIGGGDIFPES